MFTLSSRSRRQKEGQSGGMAYFFRNVVKLRQNVFSIKMAMRGSLCNRVRQPVCCIYTSNKTKDAVSVKEKSHEANIAGVEKTGDADQVNN